jgi:hypothetical protein
MRAFTTIFLIFIFTATIQLAVPVQAREAELPFPQSEPPPPEIEDVLLEKPDIQKFPQVDVYFRINPASAGLIGQNLDQSNILVLEDDKPIEGVQVKPAEPGIQLVTVINPGEPFQTRNSRGNSRFDLLAQTIKDWTATCEEQGHVNDDLSLLTTNGSEVTHNASYSSLNEKLSTYSLPKTVKPEFSSLVKALDLAMDNAPRSGMGKAVLFITAPPSWDDDTTYDNLISRAHEQSVHFFIWMVAGRGYAASPAVNALMNLSDKTGGNFFFYTGAEDIPNMEELLKPLRNVYHLSYNSSINASGSHRLLVQVNAQNQMFSSKVQSFDIELAYPQPIFISPPREIIRQEQIDPADNESSAILPRPPEVKNYLPTAFPLKILVDFPDGYRRPVKRTALYVDGQMVAENLQPPFDQFSWDLSKQTASAEHLLQAEVIDTLGLSGVSIEMPVKIRITSAQLSIMDIIARQGKLIAGIAIALSGIVLFWALVMGGRIHPQTFFLETKNNISKHRYLDPVTQPVAIRSEPVTQPRMMRVDLGKAQTNVQPSQSRYNEGERPTAAPGLFSRIAANLDAISHRPSRSSHRPVYLTRLIEMPGTGISVDDSRPFAVISKEVSIGSNPKEVSLFINDPSVEPVHAVLTRRQDGAYWVSDLGSTAGTWVNYAPISPNGAMLKSGDILHIGRVGFRFTGLEPGTKPRRATISPL